MTDTPAAELRRLRAALRDPAAWVGDRDGARAAYLVRAHALESVTRAARAAAVRVLLVKGAALALTVYPQPWLRPMADIDLMVAPPDEQPLEAALQSEGWTAAPVPSDRRLSFAAFSERTLRLPLGPLTVGLEVHGTLDKLVARPGALAPMLDRARPAPGLEGLLVPEPHDHAALVIAHLSNSEFCHPVGWLDLGRLFEAGLDLAVLERRLARAALGTSAYVTLQTLRALGCEAVPAELVARLRPGPLRRRALALRYHPGGYPVLRGAPARGLGWVLGQAPLRDDLGRWLAGVGRYAAARAVERLLRRRPPAGRATS